MANMPHGRSRPRLAGCPLKRVNLIAARLRLAIIEELASRSCLGECVPRVRSDLFSLIGVVSYVRCFRPRPPVGVYADRVAGGHRHHCHLDWPAAAGGPEGARGRCPYAVPE